MLTDATAILREHRLALPSDLALLIKCFVSLESMGRGLDPGFHMASEALPMLRQAVRARWQPRALALRAWGSLRRGLSLAGSLPGDLTRLLRAARRGRVHVGLEVAHLRRVGDQIDRAASRLSLALVTSALIVGSSIVMTVGTGPMLFGLPAFGVLGFGAALIGAFGLARSVRRSRRQNDDDRG
jgi:ubiquinone biosynthesis protein